VREASRVYAARLFEDPAVKAALDAIKRDEPHFIEGQIRMCEIPAPPFHEDARGNELERLFKQMGLQDVRIDKAGNVIGVRPGAAERPNLLFQAHLDTVFTEETNVKVTREGDVLKGPSIGDDCRGLAMMLGSRHRTTPRSSTKASTSKIVARNTTRATARGRAGTVRCTGRAAPFIYPMKRRMPLRRVVLLENLDQVAVIVGPRAEAGLSPDASHRCTIKTSAVEKS
jgi:hypothetical protein